MNNQLILFLSVFSSLSSLLLVNGESADFSWHDCYGSAIRFNSLDFDPKPLVLSETKELFLSGNVEILQQLPENLDMTIEVNKTITFSDDDQPFNITLPCIQDTFGSCTIKLCDAFNTWYNDLFCPFFLNSHHSCNCPIEKGTYTLEHGRVQVPFDKFKGFFAQMASGDYNAKFTIKNIGHFGNGDNLLACLMLHARLVEKK